MPTLQLAGQPAYEKYAYAFKTNTHMRRRIDIVAQQYGMSFNAALHILLNEALNTRGIGIDTTDTTE